MVQICVGYIYPMESKGIGDTKLHAPHGYRDLPLVTKREHLSERFRKFRNVIFSCDSFVERCKSMVVSCFVIQLQHTKFGVQRVTHLYL